MTLMRVLILGALLGGCRDRYDGTFVGNPSLTAGYVDNPVQRGRGGALALSELLLEPCDGEPVSLGAVDFAFVGAASTDVIQVPAGDYCGLSLDVAALEVRFDEGGADVTTVIGRDFTQAIAQPFTFANRETGRIRLGNAGWLAALAALVEPGGTVEIDDGALASAFFAGLDASTVDEVRGEEPSTSGLVGRVDIADYEQSPLGQSTTIVNCVPGSNFDPAVPIPNASMASRGLGEGLGWCEGHVVFSADLAPLTASQTDYSDGSTYTVTYNGWDADCGGLLCGEVHDDAGMGLGVPCGVLAWCDAASGDGVVTGFLW